MNAIIYARSATHDKQAISKQINDCKAYAAANGLNVLSVAATPEEFEVGILGLDIEKVIISTPSRLSRNAREHMKIITMLNHLKIDVVAVNE